MMTVSVVIPTIHACDHLLDPWVESISQYGRTGLLDQIIVEDAGGTYAEQCNRAAERCTGDIIVFANDDMTADGDWLHPLVAPFEDETVGITGARLLYPSGLLQHGGIRLTTDPGWNAFNITEEAYDGPIHAVTGACLAIRRGLFNQLGGFFEGYRNGAEDVDLCLRTWQAGSQVVYCPDSTVIHHESQSGPERWKYIQENVNLFRSRWSFTVGVAWTGDDNRS